VADNSRPEILLALGDTPEEAVRESHHSQEAWLNAVEKAKKRVPKPRYRPALIGISMSHFSGSTSDDNNQTPVWFREF